MLRHASFYIKTPTVCISDEGSQKGELAQGLIEVTYLFNYSSKECVA